MSESISRSFSKDSVYESVGIGMADAALAEAIRGKDESISNESIQKGDTILDTYDVTTNAIRGGMGSVWQVHHRAWNVVLAMKRPLPKLFAEGSQRRKENFIAECESWIGLGLHPNIVSCYYVREIGGVPTIFSEWMDNGSLGDRIRDGSLYTDSEAEVQERLISIAIQFASGLAYAHAAGLIHQDVKPDNLLLTKEMDAKVSDFGLARARGFASESQGNDQNRTQMAPTGGFTPAYCSPEQAAGQKLTRRTDIYSWALSVLEMYCGGRMWESATKAASDLPKCFAKARIPLPCRLQELLAACLSPSADLRPRDFGEITAVLCEEYRRQTGTDFPLPSQEQLLGSAGALNNRALSYYDLGKTEKAEELFTAALSESTSHADALFNRALANLRRGEIDLYEAKQQLAPIVDEALRSALCAELDKENSGKTELILNEGQLPLPEGTIALSNDGERVLKAEKAEKKLWDFFKKDASKDEHTRYCVCSSAGKPLFQHTVNQKTEARLSADGKTVIFSGAKETEAFSVDTGKSLFRCEEMCHISPDGKYIVGYQPRGMQDFNGLITTTHQRRPFIFRLEGGTKHCFRERKDCLAFSQDGRILFRDDMGIYSLHDPESDEEYGKPLFKDEMKMRSLRRFGTRKGTRFLLENDEDLYDLSSQKKLLRLPARFHRPAFVCLLNEGKYVLTIANLRKKHYETANGASYMTIAVWETATGHLVYETQADLLYTDRRKDDFYTFYDGRNDYEPVMGGTYTPGQKAAFRLTGIESTNERKQAAKEYHTFMEEAKEAWQKQNVVLALQKLRSALSVKGYANSEEALSLRAEYGQALAKAERVRLVPLRIPARENTESPAREAYGNRVSDIVRQKKQEQIAATEKNFPDAGRENYSAQCWEERDTQYSANGEYFSVTLITNEHYYDMSPEVNDPDPENTLYRGFLLFHAKSESLVYEKPVFLQDPDDDSPTNVLKKYDEKFRVIPGDCGGRALVIDLEDNLYLQRCDASAPEKLMQNDCVRAMFLDNDRFILTLHRNGDAEVFGGAEKTKSIGKVQLRNCNHIFPMDGNRFGYTVDGRSFVCAMDWTYAQEQEACRQ